MSELTNKRYHIRFDAETPEVEVDADSASIDDATKALTLWRGDEPVGYFPNYQAWWVGKDSPF